MNSKRTIRRQAALAVLLIASASIPASAAEKPFLQRTIQSFFREIGNLIGIVAVQPARAAAVARAAPNNYSGHMKQLASMETTYFKKVCQPTADELKGYMEESQRLGKELAKEFEKSQNHQSLPDPREKLGNALVDYVVKKLPEEKSKRYREEMKTRQDARKEAVLGMMVGAVDRHVSLNDRQLDSLKEATLKKWKPAWGRNLSLFTYVDEYIPLPDQAVLNGVLTKEQQVLLKGRQNYGEISFGWDVDLGFRDFTGIFNPAANLNGFVLEVVEVEAEEAVEEKPAKPKQEGK